MAQVGLKLPTMNQLIATAITLAILAFVVKLLPPNVQSFFRISKNRQMTFEGKANPHKTRKV